MNRGNWLFWAGVVSLVWFSGCVGHDLRGIDWSKVSADPEYRIGPDDILLVDFWARKDLSREIRVRPDGFVDLPLIGEVKASDLKPEELKKTIIKRMETYEKNPVVTVSVKEVRSYRVFVTGKVANPGMFRPSHRISVLQALALAGGVTPFASENRIVVLRRDGGKERRYPFVYGDVVSGKVSEMNIILASGDTIVVP